jgi:DNA invertase Pin-like site-specific DNA recombinase
LSALFDLARPDDDASRKTAARAVIYTRISDRTGTRQLGSLQVQLLACQTYADGHGWSVAAHYHDAMTGRSANRPQYQAMLAAVRRLSQGGQHVAIIVAALDRLGRHVLEGARCRAELRAFGASVHSVREGGELSDLVADILSAIAQEEARLTGARAKAAFQHLASTGWHTASKVPWGYRRRAATTEERAAGSPRSVLEVDPVIGPHVSAMFCKAADGTPILELIRWLQSVPELNAIGLKFHFTSVRRRLQNPTYIARTQARDPDVLKRPVGHWPALVDDATWDQVQQLLAVPTPSRTAGDHLLIGYLRCATCGRRAYYGAGRFTCDPRGVGVRQYGCSSHIGAEPSINAAVVAELTKVLEPTRQCDCPALMAALRRSRSVVASARGPNAVRRLEAQVDQARRRLSHASVLLSDGDLDATGFDMVRAAMEAELQVADTKLRHLHHNVRGLALPSVHEIAASVGRWLDALHSGDVRRQREVLGILVQSVRVRRLGRARFAAQVEWTSVGMIFAELASTKECGQ